MNPTTQSPPLPRGLERVPMSTYREHPALSRTDLDWLAMSPAHFQHYRAHGSADSDAYRLGRVLHLLVEGRASELAIWEGGDRRGPKWVEFAVANADKEIIKPKELEPLAAMHANLLQKRAPIFRDAHFEASAFATRPDGVQVKCRPDIIAKDGFVYDVKTAENATAAAFQNAAFRYGYHRQAAWYLDALELATGIRYEGFAFIAIEKTAPYDSNVFYADAGFLSRGQCENEELVEIFAECARQGRWPGFPASPQPLSLPRHALS